MLNIAAPPGILREKGAHDVSDEDRDERGRWSGGGGGGIATIPHLTPRQRYTQEAQDKYDADIRERRPEAQAVVDRIRSTWGDSMVVALQPVVTPASILEKIDSTMVPLARDYPQALPEIAKLSVSPDMESPTAFGEYDPKDRELRLASKYFAGNRLAGDALVGATLSMAYHDTIRDGWHPFVDDPVEGVLTHEFAHALGRRLGDRTVAQIVTDAAPDGVGDDAVAAGLSKYAQTNLHEFFAEAMTEYRLADHPRAMAEEVGRAADAAYIRMYGALGKEAVTHDVSSEARDDHGRWTAGSESDAGVVSEQRRVQAGVLDQVVAPITEAEARGNSRPVSQDEFQGLATEGKQRLDEMHQKSAPITGLIENWGPIKEAAYKECQKSWGGMTIDAHTGVPIESDADMFALSVKADGIESMSIPEKATPAAFSKAMNEARDRFRPELEQDEHYLGVFHDDDNHRIDIDPVVVVKSVHDVESIGAYTHAIGGAYHFKSGDGYFPPHVSDSATKGDREMVHWKGPGHWRSAAEEAQRKLVKFSDDESRDYHGRWTSDGGGGHEFEPPHRVLAAPTKDPQAKGDFAPTPATDAKHVEGLPFPVKLNGLNDANKLEVVVTLQNLAQRYPDVAKEISWVHTGRAGGVAAYNDGSRDIVIEPYAYQHYRGSGSWATATDSRGCLVHEFGHAVHQVLRDKDASDFGKTEMSKVGERYIDSKLSGEDRKDPTARTVLIGHELSDYATVDPYEFFAEAFTEHYLKGDGARPLARLIGTEIDRDLPAAVAKMLTKRARHWPGWDHDLCIADSHAPGIQDWLAGALGDNHPTHLALRYMRHAGSSLTKGVDPFDPDATAAWLTENGVGLDAAEGNRLLGGLYAEGTAVGHRVAHGVLTKSPTPADELIGRDGGWGLQGLLDNVGLTIKGMNDHTLARVGRALGAGVEGGEPPKAIAKDINSIVHDRDRALLIARTETIRAMNAASLRHYYEGGVKQIQWLNSHDDKVCPECADNEDEGPVDIGEVFQSGDWHPPAHPQCFPAGTLVSGPQVTAVTSRVYEGRLATIVFASGKELAVTPNHPLLTPRGWVAAGDLHEGVDVLRAIDAEGIAALVYPDDCQVVTSIEDVAASLREAGLVSTARVPTSAEDFHGDGMVDQEVEVVSTARFRVGNREAAGDEQAAEERLVGTERDPGPPFGDADAVLFGLWPAPAGEMGRFQHGGALSFVGTAPPLHHGVRPVAEGEPGFGQHSPYRRTAHAEARSESVDRGTAGVGPDQSGGGSQPLLAGYPAASDLAVEGRLADTRSASDLAGRLANLIAPDRVVELVLREWSGHVYNLETVGGWYVADGIIAHNCRCTILPVAGAPDTAASVDADLTKVAPKAAGLAVRAEDTGRVLLLQRAHDEIDPASGCWEFGGGHIEAGESPFAAALREWSEEVGCHAPHGHVVGVWRSPDGVYAGYVLSVPSEADVDINLDRPRVENPDAPQHAKPETAAWFDIDDLVGMPALRDELARDLPAVLDELRRPVVKAAHDVSDEARDEKGRWATAGGSEVDLRSEFVNGGKIFWHGSPNGEPGAKVAAYGLHVGTYQAAKEALEARIGRRADGKDWDGTQEYGKTLLDRNQVLHTLENGKWVRHLNESPPEYPSGRASYSDGSPIPLTAHPNLFPVRLVGPMTNTPTTPHEDFKANGYMAGALKRGNAKRGYYYTEVGEDSGSIAAVVPSGKHLQTFEEWKAERTATKAAGHDVSDEARDEKGEWTAGAGGRYQPEPGAPAEGYWTFPHEPRGPLRDKGNPSWHQDHRALVADALSSWKGDPISMAIHLDHEAAGAPLSASGSGKIMRAQAGALAWETANNPKTFNRTLYRGEARGNYEIPKVGDIIDYSLRPRGFTSNRSVATAFSKEKNPSPHYSTTPVLVESAPGARGLKVSDYVGVGGIDQAEQEHVLGGKHRVVSVEEPTERRGYWRVRTEPVSEMTGGSRGDLRMADLSKEDQRLWGDRHEGSQAITAASARLLGLPALTDEDDGDDERTGRIAQALHNEIENAPRRGTSKLYSGQSMTAERLGQFKVGSTVRLPVTATFDHNWDGTEEAEELGVEPKSALEWAKGFARGETNWGKNKFAGGTPVLLEFASATPRYDYGTPYGSTFQDDEERDPETGVAWADSGERIVAGDFKVTSVSRKVDVDPETLDETEYRVIRLRPVGKPKVDKAAAHDVSDEARDDHGRWTAGGGGGAGTALSSFAPYSAGPTFQRDDTQRNLNTEMLGADRGNQKAQISRNIAAAMAAKYGDKFDTAFMRARGISPADLKLTGAVVVAEEGLANVWVPDPEQRHPSFKRLDSFDGSNLSKEYVDDVIKKGDAAPAASPEAMALIRASGTSVLIQAWAATSNDTNPKSLAMQEAAEDEFGLEGTSGWPTADVTSADEEYKQNGGLYRAFLRTQYEQTQADLKARGLTGLELVRGVTGGPEDNAAEDNGDGTAQIELRPLSAWSMSDEPPEWATNGAGATITAHVPANRILSTAMTGFGCTNESEAVVLGGTETVGLPAGEWAHSGENIAQANADTISSWAGNSAQAEWAEGWSGDDATDTKISTEDLDSAWAEEMSYYSDQGAQDFLGQWEGSAGAATKDDLDKFAADFTSDEYEDPSNVTGDAIEAGWRDHVDDENGTIGQDFYDRAVAAGADGQDVDDWMAGYDRHHGTEEKSGVLTDAEDLQKEWDTHLAAKDEAVGAYYNQEPSKNQLTLTGVE